ncbi:Disease resistance protein TAO1 [Vitis vinifera]|uniref:Disease resistance protein TAO1 n=1 Tax=Vitis vinifera TaxID=29760 RepID=A0A438IE65_VITVI|nr:Disease resistance protein TAO1 [Vitis vinifera]
MNSKLLHINDDIVGMDFHLKELKSLSSDLNDIRVVGIYGPGGIGKTTIAKIVYNEIQYQFTSASFLQDVRETFNKGCQLQLQQQLLHDTMGNDVEFSNINKGINIIKARLDSKKVLIVIDDVDHLEQLKLLVGSLKWFGIGSIIIITTRDQHLLGEYGVDISYKVEQLHYKEAIQLFSRHAFKQNVPKEDYVNLSNCMVHYAQGLPLALKVLEMGWAIVHEECPGDLSKWSRLWDVDDIYDAFSRQEGMESIQTISLDLSRSKEIQFTTKVFAKMKKLRLLKVHCNDHDGLKREEYKVFFPKDFEFPHNLRYLHWQGCTLRSLPSKFYGENLIEINLKSSNIKQLWKGNKCLGKLKGIDLSNSKHLVKMPKFSSMANLERLNLKGCTSLRKLHSSIGHLKRLTYLNLGGCEQLQSFPTSMKFESLEVLYLYHCQNLEKFDVIHGNMKHLKELYLNKTRIRELPSSIMHLASLEVLDLSNCSNLEKFPEIHGNMKFLRKLWLKGCSKFEKFPDIFTYMGHLREINLRESGIKELPDNIGYLEYPETLDLTYCLKFEKFLEIRRNMKCLKKLSLHQTAIKELPDSIGSLTSLEILYVNKCLKFEKFSDIFTNMRLLRELDLSQSGTMELPDSIGYLESLISLDLSECSNFQKFPEIQGSMKCLKRLSLEKTAIKEFPKSIRCLEALETLLLSGCSNFEKFLEIQKSSIETFWEITEDMEHLECLYLREMAITELPSSIEHLRGLWDLELYKCEKLVSLPSNIDASENHIHCIPVGITQLSNLETLLMNHCPMLEEIAELPSSLTRIEAHGCPCLETETSSSLFLCNAILLFQEVVEYQSG